MKKGLRNFFCLFSIMVLLSGCSILRNEPTDNLSNVVEYTNSDDWQSIGDNIPVSRAIAAKMVALTFYDINSIESQDIYINFNDVGENDWFYYYVNKVFLEGYMSGASDNFRPLDNLTLREAQILLNKINPNSVNKIELTDENRDKAISYSLWTQLFKTNIEEISNNGDFTSDYGIYEMELKIFATPGNSGMKAWSVATDKMSFRFNGFNMDAYIDKTIKALVKNGEILAMISVNQNNSTIFPYAYIEKSDDNINVYVGGGYRSFNYTDAVSESGVANVRISDNNIIELESIDKVITDIINLTNNEYIELKNYGRIPLSSDFRVYNARNGNVSIGTINNLIVGTDIADFYLEGNEIVAAVIRRDAKPNQLRVLLSKNDFDGYIHDEVIIESQNGFTVSTGDEVLEFKPGEQLMLTLHDDMSLFSNNRVYITPLGDDGKLGVKSIKRELIDRGYPLYRGSIEVEKRDDGYVLVNQVDIEKYLYNVIPSEMPVSYGLEALKVQAVAARSYSYNQFYANSFHNYGANIDDSIISQVYNNIDETEISNTAVDATKGLALTFNNTVINANFFSTSSGVTANSGEVWANTVTNEFPTTSPEYLSSQIQYKNADYGLLSIDENADKFLRDTNIDSFDSWSPWFRWNTKMTVEELSNTINYNLSKVYESSPSLVKTLQLDGNYKSVDIDTIGTLKDIIIVRRGVAGNIMEVVFVGDQNEVMVKTEYSVRRLLAPKQYNENGEPVILTLNDGDIVKNMSSLPSGFFTMEKEYDEDGNLIAITFYGGGYGHGVGMSQNGARGMADEGYSFEDILTHYFSGSEIKKVL